MRRICLMRREGRGTAEGACLFFTTVTTNADVQQTGPKGRGRGLRPRKLIIVSPPTPNFLCGCFCAKAEASSFFVVFIGFSSPNLRKMHNFVKETQQESSVAQCIQRGKIETARTHNANDADLHSATTQLPIVVKEEPMDVEEASIQGLMSVKQEDRGSHSISTLVEMAHSSSPSQDIKPVPKVDCPVCSVSVSQQFINKHLDTCLSRGEKKESLRSSFGKGRRPMGRLVYNLLSLQELKRRLKECHLSVRGSRDQLIKRHREFVHIYNAECDSLNPRSAEDIAKELEANEKMRNQMQGKAKPVLVFSKKHTEKEIDEMHSNYRKQHSSDFSRLIAQVRGRLETTRQTCIKQEVIVEGEDAPDTHSADQVAESKGCSVIKVEDEEADAESSARRIELSASPTYSDVSISRDTEGTSVQKRRSSSRGDDADSSPVLGKRRRKT